MADANGRVVGDPYYDPSTETDPSQSAGNGFAFNPNTAFSVASPTPTPSMGTLGNPFTPVPGTTPLDQTGITGVSPTLGVGTQASGSDLQLFSYLLSQNAGNPQAAIDQFNNLKPNNSLKPYYYPNQGKGVIGVQGQSLPYLVAPGTIDASQTDWTFGGVPGGDAGGGGSSFRLDPSYLAPFTGKFTAPGDPNNPASAAFAANPKPFTLPTEADLFAAPGFQAAQDTARNAIVNSETAKGLINSGGSLYDIANLTAGLEGQQYNDLVNQRANAYGINLGAGQQSFNNAWQQFLNNQNVFFQNQNNPFNKLSTLASLGLSAAGNAG